MTNVQLAGFGIVDSNYWVFCSEEPETIIHLFCMCKFVVTFWQDLSDWLSVKLHHDFNLKNLHKLFGYEIAMEYFSLLTDYFYMHVF